ncbi:GTP-binding signal recognition particle SRP54 G- domain [Leptothrix cholodnii SP-6]|uniref:Flagellar biosynthesis protein FlhF n=1 Tax=Leptothrix cholodnii (strain ATCC 51168 / LMG 8142 / SP-6) TaxID=395495 RepID=B1XXA6_LEPCP|nr:flagellar biosynthesis protein FlhF [Leptothrix cholodnii]ACB33887.1 GTP-binding signal recognition particle SRP54 G- domain [Leptothrix cholodnii SP-6]
MNVKRFIGRNSREAMQKVRQAFGDNAVVLSTKPCSEGIEVLAMPPESVEAIERFGEAAINQPSAAPRQQSAAPVAPQQRPASSSLRSRAAEQVTQPQAEEAAVQEDVGTLAMSTLSFQDYVRERMLKKRQAEIRAQAMKPVPVSAQAIEQRLAQREVQELSNDLPTYPDLISGGHAPRQAAAAARHAPTMHEALLQSRSAAPAPAPQRPAARPALDLHDSPLTTPAELDVLQGRAPGSSSGSSSQRSSRSSGSSRSAAEAAPSAQQSAMMNEIRAMKGMIEERFGALAFMERLQKSPKQAQLTTKLIDCGFSPALIRKLADGLKDDVHDEMAWAGDVLQRNLQTGESEAPLEDQGGVFALVGSTGVGKTTSTAKLAAAFATRHGAANLGLITLDAYRLGAHEQLRAYGRILGVPVHTAHDRVALEDLLDLLQSKKMVLIDTAGLAQRDARTRELLDMLSHPSIKRLLVVNAAAQGETIEDVLVAYKATQAKGIVLSKMDEAVKLGPAVDALIRHRLKVVAVANGQRVPEDWHRLTAQALMQRALRTAGAQAWRMDANDVNLLFASPPAPQAPRRSRSSSTPTNSSRSSGADA